MIASVADVVQVLRGGVVFVEDVGEQLGAIVVRVGVAVDGLAIGLPDEF